MNVEMVLLRAQRIECVIQACPPREDSTTNVACRSDAYAHEVRRVLQNSGIEKVLAVQRLCEMDSTSSLQLKK